MVSMKTTQNFLGQIIRERRQAVGLTHEQLAALIGCDPSTVGRLERGKTEPSVKTLRRLSAVLDIPFERFLENYSPSFQEEFRRVLKIVDYLKPHAFESFWRIGDRKILHQIFCDAQATAQNAGVAQLFGAIASVYCNPNYLQYFDEMKAGKESVYPDNSDNWVLLLPQDLLPPSLGLYLDAIHLRLLYEGFAYDANIYYSLAAVLDTLPQA
jgi:transcriptional regulator with XRE-family HTH domain